MDYIVAATAGHVDHGKTTLIKRLTGTDTDTTPEEKKRGLTINLGFAYFDLPSKRRIAFVDVPGHEKFLKNMISGLSGIDMALLVVDAGEGVMPQTMEHAEILMLLGITKLVIAVTKADTVDSEMIDLTVEDIHEHFKNTVYANAPIVIIDAVSGRGIDELVAVIDQVARKLSCKVKNANPRLNIDRAFTIKGHGTVVTGTLIDGQVALNDQLMLYPLNKTVRVKNIQVNDQDQSKALPNHRVALNIDVKLEDVHKGDVITTTGNVKDSKLIDVQVRMLKDVPMLKLNERLRIYIGSEEVFGRIYPMNEDVIKPDTKCLAQLRLERAIAVKNGDHFIIRTYSPMTTAGGGKILIANAHHHSRKNQQVLNTLTIRASGDYSQMIIDYLTNLSGLTVKKEDLASLFDLGLSQVDSILDELIMQNKVVKIDNYYYETSQLDQLVTYVVVTLKKFQQEAPLQPGMLKAELISKINDQYQAKIGPNIVNYLLAKQKVKVTGNYVANPDFEVRLTSSQAKVKEQLSQELNRKSLTPVSLDELTASPATMPILAAFDGKEFIKLNNDYYLGRAVYQRIIDKVKHYLEQHIDGIGLGEFRDLTETSRKFSIMILERLDKDGVTKRQNSKHILVKQDD